MNTSVNVASRPVTGEGLSGAHSGTGRLQSAGPRRQIQDPTFYLGLLREKSGELQAEIEKFKKEKADFEQDSKLCVTSGCLTLAFFVFKSCAIKIVFCHYVTISCCFVISQIHTVRTSIRNSDQGSTGVRRTIGRP